jgi:hypothetical protein
VGKKTPGNANEFIEEQLDAKISALEVEFNADALGYNGGILFGVDDITREVIEDKKKEGSGRDKLLVVVTTGGGYIEVVQRIVETFRYHYAFVEFVIPNYAFSAGTVLALSGDAIHMDYYSRLGPIDPQVEVNGKMVPALGYLHQYDRLVKKAQANTITLAEIQLLVDGFDQAELYQYEQARNLSITLLKEWLVKYKFKNWTATTTRGIQVDDALRKQRAEEIAHELNKTGKWHSHGRGISRDVLVNDLKVQIDDFGTCPVRTEMVKGYHRLLDDYMGKRSNNGVLHTAGNYKPFA